jgi:spermidine/putrescine transport system permease protein
VTFAAVRRHALTAYAALAFAYLLVPVAVVIAFSFNDPAGHFNYTWQGFTLDNWTNPFGVPGLRGSIELSLEIAALSSVLATVLGTLVALALVRYSFRGRATTNMLIFLPMTSPEIVLGASLLAHGIMAALFLAFALSVDDFVITNVNAGAEVTFPMYVWGAARVGVPPQVNVIGTVIFLLAIVAMLGNVLLQMRRKGTT